MKIETKFNVGDLVVSKYSRSSIANGSLLAYEVIEVLTQTCYKEAQVFYLCRSIHCVIDKEYGKPPVIVDMGIGSSQESHEPYFKMREDELKEAPAQVQEDVKVGIGIV